METSWSVGFNTKMHDYDSILIRAPFYIPRYLRTYDSCCRGE